MTQMRFLNNGNVVRDGLFTKVVGLRFNEASSTLEKGQVVTVQPVDVDGFDGVLGVFNSHGQVGNIVANLTDEDIIESVMGGFKIFTNKDLAKDFKDLTFVVKTVRPFFAVLTANFQT